MTCGACAVRIEKKLNRLDQVSATVNFATERASVTAPAALPAAELAHVIAAAGYSACVFRSPGPDPLGGPDTAGGPAAGPGQSAYLRRRLMIALAFFVPLSDLSVQLSLFPAFRFPGWPWVLIGLAAPVAGWAAWPFHRAALRNLRHGAVTMDTLVSLGIGCACGWSAYAMFFVDRPGAAASAGSAVRQLVRGSGGGIYLEVAAAVTTFLLAGRFFEARGRRMAGESMRELARAGARTACLLASPRWTGR